jgi:hypothetical protein
MAKTAETLIEALAAGQLSGRATPSLLAFVGVRGRAGARDVVQACLIHGCAMMLGAAFSAAFRRAKTGASTGETDIRLAC